MATIVVAVAFALTVVVGRREDRFALQNDTSETLRKVRVEYTGGAVEAPNPIVAGGSVTLAFRPHRRVFSLDPAPYEATLRFEMADGTPMESRPGTDGVDYWTRANFLVYRLPNGTPSVLQYANRRPALQEFVRRLGGMTGR